MCVCSCVCVYICKQRMSPYFSVWRAFDKHLIYHLGNRSNKQTTPAILYSRSAPLKKHISIRIQLLIRDFESQLQRFSVICVSLCLLWTGFFLLLLSKVWKTTENYCTHRKFNFISKHLNKSFSTNIVTYLSFERRGNWQLSEWKTNHLKCGPQKYRQSFSHSFHSSCIWIYHFRKLMNSSITKASIWK